MNIVIALTEIPAGLERLKQIAPEAEVRVMPHGTALDAHLDWAEIVFANITPDQIRHAPGLRWVQLNSSGFEPYLSLRDWPGVLTTARGITSKACAEHVLGLMLMFTRRWLHFQQRQRARAWDRCPQIVGSLVGQTLGIVGYGTNGKALARRAKAMEMRVIAVKRTPAETPPELDKLWTVDRLDELLAQADHVAVLIPMTTETRGLMGAAQFERMKPGALLYNVSRGGIVDERALLAALQSGRLGGAALDVFEQEPLPADSPFWTLPNVIVTPHLGAAWGGMWDAAFDLFCENLRRFRAGEPLLNVADLARGY
ncbi:MAG TPA: D-2-hydroxyacid dehydrogenase [Blastocatellia bacterium]|nr:D-2-hydroxyacid dehydrogenase [Blastocatellia bacterium]